MLKTNNKSGLTLIEIMISVALLSIVAASAVAMYYSGQTMNKANNDKQTVYKALQEAVEQVKKNINTSTANANQPFVSENAFTVVGLNISLKGEADGDLHFNDDGEDVGPGNGTQLGRVVVESVDLQDNLVNFSNADLLRITAEVRANYREGGVYLDEQLVLFINK